MKRDNLLSIIFTLFIFGIFLYPHFSDESFGYSYNIENIQTENYLDILLPKASGEIVACNDISTEQKIIDVQLTAQSVQLPIFPDDNYVALTFNGQIPGPTIRATQGDIIRIDFVIPEDESRAYGINSAVDEFPESVYRMIPGTSTTLCFVAENSGVFQYRGQGSDEYLTKQDIFSGMYGMMIIDPQDGYRKLMVESNTSQDDNDRIFYSPNVQEYQLQFSQLYLNDGGEFDFSKLIDRNPSSNVLNGMISNYVVPHPGFNLNDICIEPNDELLTKLYSLPSIWSHPDYKQYQSQIIYVPIKEPVRIFVMNHNDEESINFRIINEVMNRITVNNNISNENEENLQIDSSQGAIVDILFDESGVYFVETNNISADTSVPTTQSVIIALAEDPCIDEFENPVERCNPSDIIPPLGENSKDFGNIIIHGLYTDERAVEIADQIGIENICVGGSLSLVEGRFHEPLLSFENEIVGFEIKDAESNLNPFQTEMVTAKIVKMANLIHSSQSDAYPSPTAMETNADSDTFVGQFSADEYPMTEREHPEEIGLKYGSSNFVLDTKYLGCGELSQKYVPTDDIRIYYDITEQCSLGCNKIIIYDPNLDDEDSPLSINFTITSSRGESWNEQAHDISLENGFYGFSRFFIPTEFRIGDSLTITYNGISVIVDLDQNMCFDMIDECDDIVNAPPFCLSPHHQFHLGISNDNISCKDGLELLIKKSDSSPACVSFNTKEKLIQRGWID